MSRLSDFEWLFGTGLLFIGVSIFGGIKFSLSDDNLGLILISLLSLGSGVLMISDFVWDKLEYYEDTFWKVLGDEGE